ncbi:FAD-dependent oxidoreductase [Thermophagus sp. OGC60D27]|uniref:FAD-dependent oxidoreductase n=1 Tax=Thermophagus sp. OGC60D27 TaxID=3458415 RepID=UPI004037A7AB
MLSKFVRSISTPIRLIEVIEEAPSTYTFKFSVPEKIQWSPGAYAHFLSSSLANGEKLKKELVRELSIMSHPDENFIGFTTRIRENPSQFKRIMLNINVGDEIRMFKMGNHFAKAKFEDPIVLISMGVGIATFRPLILEHLKKTAAKTPLININIDRSGNFVYRNELDKLPDNKIHNCMVTNRADLYERIDQCVDRKSKTFCVVGSKEFNKDIGDYLLKKKVPQKSIVFDKH